MRSPQGSRLGASETLAPRGLRVPPTTAHPNSGLQCPLSKLSLRIRGAELRRPTKSSVLERLTCNSRPRTLCRQPWRHMIPLEEDRWYLA